MPKPSRKSTPTPEQTIERLKAALRLSLTYLSGVEKKHLSKRIKKLKEPYPVHFSPA